LKKHTQTTYTGIKKSRNIRTILLFVVFIRYVPNILNAGNNIGNVENIFSVGVNSIFGKEKLEFLLTLKPIIANIIKAMLNEINSGIVANGVEYPSLRDNVFISNP
jgi:hypothetical protein